MKPHQTIPVLFVLAIAASANAAPLKRPCGPNSMPKALKILVPQGAAGADFRPACRQHDSAYRKGSGLSKEQSDCQFLHNMLRACECSRRPGFCKRRAKRMYWMVDRFGDSAYGK